MSEQRNATRRKTGGTVLQVSNAELWLIRTAGAAIIATLGWIGMQFHAALIHVAEIRAQLAVVKPADVLAAVHELEKITISREEVAAIARATSEADREHLRAWRNDVEQRMAATAALQQTTAETLRAAMADRWTRTDMAAWVRLGNANGQLQLPEPRAAQPAANR